MPRAEAKTIGTTAISICTRNAAFRCSRMLAVHSDEPGPVYIGLEDSVTVETGIPIYPGESLVLQSVEMGSQLGSAQLYAIAEAETVIRIQEGP